MWGCGSCCTNDENAGEVVTVQTQAKGPISLPVASPPRKDPGPFAEPAVEVVQGEPQEHVKQPEVARPQLNPGEFMVTLYRKYPGSGHIGVNVSHIGEGNKNIALIIKEVKEGLVHDWNRANPGKVIKPGHHVVEANGIRGDSGKMLKPISTAEVVELIVKDPSFEYVCVA